MTLQELIEKHDIQSNDGIDLEYYIRCFDDDIEDVDINEVREKIEDGINETCGVIGYKNAFDFLIENDHTLRIVKNYLREIHGDSVPISDIDIQRFASIVNYEKQMGEVYGIVRRINDAIDEELSSGEQSNGE